MNCDDVLNLLFDFEEGRLTPKQTDAVRQHLATCESCRREQIATRALHRVMSNDPAPTPGSGLRPAFYSWLETEKRAASTGPNDAGIHGRPWIRHVVFAVSGLVAACVIFACGIFVGSRVASPDASPQPAASTQRELAALRHDVDSMGKVVAWSLLQQASASERLKSIHTLQTDTENIQAVDELLAFLAYDTSSSVRLSAVEALSRHAGSPIVIRAIERTLPAESSPIVQLAMIDLLASTRDPSAAVSLERFSQNPSQVEVVRDAALQARASM